MLSADGIIEALNLRYFIPPEKPAWHTHEAAFSLPSDSVVEFGGHDKQELIPSALFHRNQVLSQNGAEKLPIGHAVPELEPSSAAYSPAEHGLHASCPTTDLK